VYFTSVQEFELTKSQEAEIKLFSKLKKLMNDDTDRAVSRVQFQMLH
jgi:hypothetical protein